MWKNAGSRSGGVGPGAVPSRRCSELVETQLEDAALDSLTPFGQFDWSIDGNAEARMATAFAGAGRPRLQPGAAEGGARPIPPDPYLVGQTFCAQRYQLSCIST